MVVFIIASFIVLISLGLLVFDYLYIRNDSIVIESRIKRFIFGGIEILFVGIFLVALVIIGANVSNLEIRIEGYLIFILSVLAVIIYVGLIFIWSSLFRLLKKNFKKNINPRHRLNSISIYGLIYSFGILFYLIYCVVFFK